MARTALQGLLFRDMVIYKATNIITGKVYIGKTAHDLKARRLAHLSMARLGKGHYFQRSIAKYGGENFEWVVLRDYCRNLKEQNKTERLFIEAYQSNDRRYGYNLTPGGDGGKGFKHTEEAKRKISEAGKGQKISEEHMIKMRSAMLEKKRKPVRNTVTGDEFISITEAAKHDGATKGNVSDVLHGRRKTINGFRYEYI